LLNITKASFIKEGKKKKKTKRVREEEGERTAWLPAPSSNPIQQWAETQPQPQRGATLFRP